MVNVCYKRHHLSRPPICHHLPSCYLQRKSGIYPALEIQPDSQTSLRPQRQSQVMLHVQCKRVIYVRAIEMRQVWGTISCTQTQHRRVRYGLCLEQARNVKRSFKSVRMHLGKPQNDVLCDGPCIRLVACGRQERVTSWYNRQKIETTTSPNAFACRSRIQKSRRQRSWQVDPSYRTTES